MKRKDVVRARRDAYREQAVDSPWEALMTPLSSAAHARAVREGPWCAKQAETLSWALDETTEEGSIVCGNTPFS